VFRGEKVNLVTVDLSNNQLTSLPNSLFEHGASIAELDASNNMLTGFRPSSAEVPFGMKRLRNLDVSHNRIATLDTRLFSHSVLNQLTLDGNPITLDDLKAVDGFDVWAKRQASIVNKQLAGGLVVKLN
jgi:protein toll